MSDEDGDEEAELARLRAARMGPEAVARLEALRRRAAASTRDGAVFADGATVVEEAPGPAPAPAEAADEADAEALLRASLPSSFGAAAAPPRAASAAAARAPPPAALAAARRASPPRPSPLDDGDDGGGDAGGDDDDGYHLPVTHEALLSGHARLVGALDVDRAGARLASGGSDGVVNIYDFAGMRSNLAPFRTLTPDGGHGARALSWSPTGELLLCVTSSAEPRVLDRDGREQARARAAAGAAAPSAGHPRASRRALLYPLSPHLARDVPPCRAGSCGATCTSATRATRRATPRGAAVARGTPPTATRCSPAATTARCARGT